MNGALRLRRLGIDTYRQPVVYIRADSPVCRSEGFEAQSRVVLQAEGRSVVATLNVVLGDLLHHDEVGVSEEAWRRLGVREGSAVTLSHARALDSFAAVRAKIHDQRLGPAEFGAIVEDIHAGRYADVHIASFITACAANPLDTFEIVALSRAMVRAGEVLRWDRGPVVDKHCVGGLPGNRTTPIVVAIVAAAGLVIPKTSSRAITSPAGTADTMEMLAPVNLELARMRRVVEREGGCVVWGGGITLSPVDDLLIRVERPLDLDHEGQLVASVLSKKLAAGSTHVLIDVPCGPSAKVRTDAAASRLGATLVGVGHELGLHVEVMRTDGRQPVGRGVGPALEARDVLAVLRNHPDAPADLRDRAALVAGRVLEMGGLVGTGEGVGLALALLADGRAGRKFEAICEAQGGARTPPSAPFTRPVTARRGGVVVAVDNRALARVGKLAGAPRAPAAGLVFDAPIGRRLEVGDTLYTIHAESRGELEYALAYAESHPDIVSVGNGEVLAAGKG